MRFTYDSITGYVIADGNGGGIKGYFNTFAEAVAAVQDGDHIHMICGRGSNIDHKPGCLRHGCPGGHECRDN